QDHRMQLSSAVLTACLFLRSRGWVPARASLGLDDSEYGSRRPDVGQKMCRFRCAECPPRRALLLDRGRDRRRHLLDVRDGLADVADRRRLRLQRKKWAGIAAGPRWWSALRESMRRFAANVARRRIESTGSD